MSCSSQASSLSGAILARRRAGRAAFIPFLTAGYPDPDAFVETAIALAALGADILEIGIPFSDSIADGPVIQGAAEKAIESGVTAGVTLDLVTRIRRQSAVPIVLMSYANPLMQFGGEEGGGFPRAARDAGVQGILLTDLPPDEPHEIWDQVASAGLDPVLLVAPTTTPERLRVIAERARGFIYCVARLGVTGGGEVDDRVAALVARARAESDLPVAVGFGIASSIEAKRMAALADAVVVGTALVQALGSGEDPTSSAIAVARDIWGVLGP